MRPAFASDSVANLLFGCTVVVWVIGELRQALQGRSHAANADRYSLLLLRVCISVGVLLALSALRVSATTFGFNAVTFAVALVLMWSGVALRWWSFSTLGGYFTFTVMTSADQPVIAAGPYRLLRHPSYAGILLALAGIGLAFGNWLSLVALLIVPTIGLLYRMQVEETALSTTLGDTYTAYATGRKRLIPFVW